MDSEWGKEREEWNRLHFLDIIKQSIPKYLRVLGW